MKKSNRRGNFVRAALLGVAFTAILRAHAPLIVLSSQYLNFVVRPGDNPAVQTLTLENGTHGLMPWTATARTTNGGNWLAVKGPDGQSSGTLPGFFEGETARLTVSVNSASLAAGVYYGTITIAAPGTPPGCSPCNVPASNTPQIVEVALTVTTSGQAAPGIGIVPDTLSFEGTAGSGRTYSLSMGINNLGGGTLDWNATATTTSGGNWLSVIQQNRVTAIVAAQVGDLKKGTYEGKITVAAPGAANTPRIMPVTFAIKDPLPPLLRLSTGALTFSIMADTGNPKPQTVTISNGGDGALNWRVAASTFNGGAWLEVSPDSGSGAGTATVNATADSLGPGTYTGRITVSADGATNSPSQIAVTLTVLPPQPSFEDRGVVNAASFLSGPVAPGEIISIFGVHLGPRTGASATLDPVTGKLPTELAGTKVTFDGVAAPLFYTSFNQVNLQVPYEMDGRTTANVMFTLAGLPSTQVSVQIADAAPGVFRVDPTRAAALNEDFTLNSPDNPAAAGSVIILYITGQGQVSPKVATGAPAPTAAPFPVPVQAPGVNIGGSDARLLFAGLAPGFIGLTQINAVIPTTIRPSSQVRVAVGFGFNITPLAATIAVK